MIQTTHLSTYKHTTERKISSGMIATQWSDREMHLVDRAVSFFLQVNIFKADM